LSAHLAAEPAGAAPSTIPAIESAIDRTMPPVMPVMAAAVGALKLRSIFSEASVDLSCA